MKKVLLTAAVLCSFIFNTHAATWYVATTGNNNNNGLGWGTAFATVQKALDVVATGDQVWIAKGRYIPTANGTGKNVCFKLKNGVTLYGGFAGMETLLSSRNMMLIHSTNETILTGDLLGDDDPNDQTLTTNKTDNAYRVFSHVTADALDTSASLNGVTITGGVATASTTTGAGMYNQLCSPKLAEVIIKGNIAANGGGLYITGSSTAACKPVLNNVVVSGNIATTTGGGIYNLTNASPLLTNVVISGNKAMGTTTASGAGGMYIINSTLGAFPTLTNVSIINNISGNKGGGVYIWGSSPVFKNVTISGNTAVNGGGLFITPNGTNTPYSYPGFTNVLISGNTASTKGGGIYCETNGFATYTNTTITGNTAPTGAGLYDSISSPRIRNTIVWGNTGANITNVSGSAPVISWSLIAGSGGSGGAWISSLGTDSLGNIDAAPMFAAGSYQLSNGSPAIDAGNNALYMAAGLDINTDTALNGKPRNIGSVIDMGAYEYTASPLPVILLSFTAHIAIGYTTVAEWHVANETIQGYTLQRSSDGRQFTSVATIAATNASYYRYIDVAGKPNQSVWYYRLQTSEKSGQKNVSNIVPVYFSSLLPAVTIAPNPTIDYFTINTEDGTKEYTGFVADAVGRTITQFQLSDNQIIDTRNWVPGMYYIHLSSGVVKKIIKL